ncbi:hypothetical protein M8A51_17915 [Schlegelella sp. S2-27]|uniref:Lipopolysaccharide assembly protein A domain-containing protein n=1 Tax=Caldimonas mangrovi TaxID=2944811 RepID=A0ABT0YUA0_9BURK|nr:hypothetical protein [Caldimonas mangrovi]MCM5681408.1 hypothetical protein [Caldimonas mangrovi]
MKALLATLAGAVLVGAAAYGLLSVFASWYGSRFIQSDADINAVYLPMLIVQVLLVLVGGYVGFRWSRKQARRKQDDAKSHRGEGAI